MTNTGPIVTETARRAAESSEIHETIEFLTFAVVVLAGILIIDVLIEIYRMYERPPKRER